jgi:hypothetical protein
MTQHVRAVAAGNRRRPDAAARVQGGNAKRFGQLAAKDDGRLASDWVRRVSTDFL